MKRGLIGGSTAGAALLALFLVQNPSHPSQSSPGNQSTILTLPRNYVNETENRIAGYKSRLFREGPWKASQDYFAGMSDSARCPRQSKDSDQAKSMATDTNQGRYKDAKPAEDNTEPADILHPRSELWCIPQGIVVQAMIAIAPDPLHTRMALVFDRSIEAIQLAAATKGYVVDRYWLPWNKTSQPEWTDYISNRLAVSDEARRQLEPGLLLFRWNGDPARAKAKVLYVFLVSDTSTNGINGTQFSKAVKYFEELCRPNGSSVAGCAAADPIQIMGPTFSGSLASLRKLANTFKTKHFASYSGTVSSSMAIANQGLRSRYRLCPSAQQSEESNLEFESLVNDTECAIEKLTTVLTENKDITCSDPPEIAILAEAGTTYGAVEEKDHYCYARFVYPREIASLRNAYPRSTNIATGYPGKTSDVATGPFLTFDITDRINSGDEPPDFSIPQGPLSKEAVLMEFATELRRNRYRYVGIIGSNILDVLFLAKFLRQASPDARLFVFSPDLLFERELDNGPYIGTLTVSTYPLVARNVQWLSTVGTPSRLPFADQYQEGQYNATLMTLRQMLPSTPEPGLYEYYPPFRNTQPPALDNAKLPLWVTVVGKGGYWPIRLLEEQGIDGKEKEEVAPKLDSQDFTSGWKMLLGLLTILAVLQVGLLAISSSTSEFLWDLSMQGAAPDQRIFFLHIACSSLACALALLAVPAWRFQSPSSGLEVHILSLSAALGVVGLFLIGVLLHAHYILRSRYEEPGGKLNQRVLMPTVGAITSWTFATIILWFWWSLASDDLSHYGFFFAYRSVNLATGVSPFLPFLLLLSAVYTWSAFEIRRLRFDDTLRPQLGTTERLPGARSEAAIADAVSRYRLRKKSYIVFFGLFVVIWSLFFGLRHPFHLFERPEFGWGYQFLISLVVALMLSAALRLASVWQSLQTLLRELERSVFRDVFGRLKGLSWASIWTLGDREKDWIHLARSFEVMTQIRRCAHNGFEDGELIRDITAVLNNRERISEVWKWIQSKQARVPILTSTSHYLAALKMQPDMKASGQPPSLQLESISDTANDEVGKRLRAGVTRTTGDRQLYEFDLAFYELQRGLAAVLDQALRLLRKAYEESCAKPSDRKDQDESRIKVYYEPEKRNRRTEQMQRLEEYIALRYMTFIRGVLVHIRYLVIFIAVSFSLVLISLNIYSFEPHRSLIWSFTVIFAVIGLLIVIVLMQIYKDYTLSRITGTSPDDLGMDFYIRLIATGAAPLFALLATHFPSIGRALVSFLQPGLEALK